MRTRKLNSWIKSIRMSGLAFLLASASLPAATAQSAFNSTADTGDMGNTSEKTFQNSGASQVNQQYDAYDRSRALGSGFGNDKDTMTTSTKNYLQNSGGLLPTTTGLNAPKSVSPTPIRSGNFSLGFGGGSTEINRNGYRQSGAYGGSLPATSLGSVDIDTTSGQGANGLARPNPLLDATRNSGYWQPDFDAAGYAVQQIQNGTQQIQQGNVGTGVNQVTNGVNNVQNASNGF